MITPKNIFIKDDTFTGDELICRRSNFAAAYLKGDGIEIGALHKPLQLPADRCRVKYVDYKTIEENRKQYPELASEKIVNTDHLDDGFILASIPDHSLDFLISNHAIEHSPDPIGTLLKWHTKLRNNGILFIGVPIAEKCFDKGRKLTTLEHLCHDHELFLAQAKEEIEKVTRDHVLDFAEISDKNIRALNEMKPAEPEDSIAMADELMRGLHEALINSNKYEDLISAHINAVNKKYDIHYHTFSPKTYELFIDYFCKISKSILVRIFKNGNGECIAIIRKMASF